MSELKERTDAAVQVLKERHWSKKAWIPHYGAYVSIRDSFGRLASTIRGSSELSDREAEIKELVKGETEPRRKYLVAIEFALQSPEEMLRAMVNTKRTAAVCCYFLTGLLVIGLLNESPSMMLSAGLGCVLAQTHMLRLSVRIHTLRRQELRPLAAWVKRLGLAWFIRSWQNPEF